MRNGELNVVIYTDVEKRVLKARAGRRLKELISDAGISFPQPCGGNGRCGKCVVTFVSGAPKASALDENFLSKEELESGKRLLCRCVLERDCQVELSGGAAASEESITAESVDRNDEVRAEDCDKFAIAIDIGTTTIAGALIGLTSERSECVVLDTASGVNHQRSYGADVISRIEAASDEETRRKLTELVRQDISGIIGTLVRKNGVKELSDVAITGNTTMLHLLQGYDVSGLGVYPYRAESLKKEVITAENIGYILPGISAFVGSDIVAGIYYLGLIEDREKSLFIDLGTNGEMAFFDGKELLVTSTAAGPVFEGGGISCGVASVPGAICHVTIETNGIGESNSDDPKVSYETIGGSEPIGLCGTGVIEAVAELRRNNLINSDGLLADKYFEEGFTLCIGKDHKRISINQKDIRNVQLAKAAINAGIKTLLSGEKPDKVYVAGGFGASIDEQKIRGIKLFSQNYCDNINVVGNSSLKGAIKFLDKVLLGKEDEEKEKLKMIAGMAKEIVLAGEEGFDEKYLDALGF